MAVPLLRRFTRVVLLDSSTVVLPDVLSQKWPGTGSRTGKGRAALKLQVGLDLCSGALSAPILQEGRCHDRTSPLQKEPLPPGSLRLADLGYFSLDEFWDLNRQKVFFLSRLQAQTLVFTPSGEPLDLLRVLPDHQSAPIDLPVHIGDRHRLPVRLLAAPVDPTVRRCQPVSKKRLSLADWNILITNVHPESLSLDEALVLARARWQIELLLKLWKQHGQIDAWRTRKPWRVLCELYAKLLAMLVFHWLMVATCWTYPDRSLVKGSQTVQGFALMLAAAVGGFMRLATVIQLIARTISAGCRMNPHKRHPNTYQLLLGTASSA